VSRSPTVAVISSPQFTEKHESFLKSKDMVWVRDPGATPAENLIEFSGRICYLSFGPARQAPASNSQYIAKLITSGHESVLEHAVWTLLISGVSRSFTHQIVRHRAGFSFSQLSQQYHDESDADFVIPPGLNGRAKEEWTKAMVELKALYARLRQVSTPEKMDSREALRMQRSIARSVLPNATETCIVVSANARAIRHFLNVRGSTAGDIEMRLVSRAIFDEVYPQAPAVFSDFAVVECEDGWPIVVQRRIASQSR
jgi:thymidylate synthase (FAD)